MDLLEILDSMQEKVNKIYDDVGCTSDVLDLQVSINQLRHEFDLPDKTEAVFEDYVQ